MQTREIARSLAEAARPFLLLGPVTEEGLMTLVRAELGDEGRLDGFQPYTTCTTYTNGVLARAVGPASILHILSGNTPLAGLQSLMRGLLLGAHNWCKIPGEGLPEIAQFRERLPASLAERVEIAATLPPAWLSGAEAVIVFGNDETIAHFRARVRPDQRFLAHGHRISLGIVFADPAFSSVAGAARDVALFNQQGCLSPHLFYVAPEIAREYAQRLAGALAAIEREQPRGPVTPAEQLAIAALRDEFAFRAATQPDTMLWQSEGSTAWTVVLDPDPAFAPSPLNRTVFVKPLPACLDDLDAALAAVRPHLSAIGFHPATPAHAEELARLGASRLCPIGQMQRPPLCWHQDGQPALLPLVRWIDFEPSGPG